MRVHDPGGAQLGARLLAGDLGAAPAVLNMIESTAPTDREQAAALMRAVSPAALGGEAHAHIIGVTGPPGAGKSTLLGALLGVWRRRRRSVAVLAVDPSSKRSGGALLGDRARITFDPSDRGVFVRSTATAHRLGGLAAPTWAAAHALASAFDIVVVETVGVGQSETAIADLADTVLVILQPASGDMLQFLKAGIMEIPDLLVVTKADMGRAALDTLRDARSALSAAGSPETPALAVSCLHPLEGVDALADRLDEHRLRIDTAVRRLHARRAGALADYVTEYGERGLRALGGRRAAENLLSRLPATLDVPSLLTSLEEQSGSRVAGALA